MIIMAQQHHGAKKGFIYFILIFTVSQISPSNGLTLEFMESLCGQTYPFSTSFQMDSSTGITYKNLLDCTLTVTAPINRYILAQVTRFELEAAVTGVCTDFLDVHNGTDTSATKFHAADLCGWGTDIPSNFTSTDRSMTFRLVTDNQGVYHGFNIIFTAVYDAPCSGGDFSCTNQLCIDSSLQCDNYNQCGDNSDEENCTDQGSSSGLNVVMIAVVVTVLVVILAVVGIIMIIRIRDRNKWMKFVNSRIDYDDHDGIVEAPPSYPVTHMYYKGVRGQIPQYTDSAGATDVTTPPEEITIKGVSGPSTEKMV